MRQTRRRKAIEIHDQPRLGVRRTVFLTVSGVRYRLFRSIVSVLVIAVAVAFFMNILSATLIQRSMERAASVRVLEGRRAAAWVARLSHPGTVESILTELGRARPDDGVVREAQRFAGLTKAQTDACLKDARQTTEYLDYFLRLDYGRRRVLLRGAQGAGIFTQLREPNELGQFEETMSTLRLPRFASSLGAFSAFLARWPDIRATAVRIRDGRSKGIAIINKQLGGRGLIGNLANARGPFGDTVRRAGFSLDPGSAHTVEAQARQMLLAAFIEDSFTRQNVRRAVSSRSGIEPDDIKPWTSWELLERPQFASWYLAKLKELGITEMEPTAAQVVSVAAARNEQRMLGRVNRFSPTGQEKAAGLGKRVKWLIFISMLVCAVGITNAMLMSVTERFREIATLKCLGALDGSIMVMFVLEASLLGAAGGILGALGGGLIGLSRMATAFGRFVFTTLPTSELVLATGASIVLGVILAGGAAVYPSLKAARLAPMEAMRIE